MDRRAFLATAAAGVIAGSAVARAQQPARIHHLGILSLRSGPNETDEPFNPHDNYLLLE